jgi:hypothetical protein
MTQMFGFLDMIGNYENRKIAFTKVGRALIDTCSVSDTDAGFETGIEHPQYNGGKWIIVEEYYSAKDAKKGHEKWVAVFKKGLPEELKDVSSYICKRIADAMGCDSTYKKTDQEEKGEE